MGGGGRDKEEIDAVPPIRFRLGWGGDRGAMGDGGALWEDE